MGAARSSMLHREGGVAGPRCGIRCGAKIAGLSQLIFALRCRLSLFQSPEPWTPYLFFRATCARGVTLIFCQRATQEQKRVRRRNVQKALPISLSPFLHPHETDTATFPALASPPSHTSPTPFSSRQYPQASSSAFADSLAHHGDYQRYLAGSVQGIVALTQREGGAHARPCLFVQR